MMSTATHSPDYDALVLEWQPGAKTDGRYRTWLWGCLFAALVSALSLSLVDVPEPERVTRDDIPERVARFMVEQPERKPAPPPEPENKPKPLPVVEPEPVVQRERPERPREPVTEEERAAREEAKQSGLLAMGEKLDGLMDTSAVDEMINTSGGGGATTGTDEAGYGDGDLASAAERTQAAGVGSTRVDAQASALARRQVAAVDIPESAPQTGGSPEAERREGFSDTGRSDEEVSLVFDRNKGMLYSLYNRARRKTPGLQGRLVVEITIAPSGEVTKVQVVSSELNAPRLEARIRARILQFQFERKPAETITIIYPIDFLPS